MQYDCSKAYLKCSCCDNIFPIWRITGRQKKKDHIKHLYCWKCQKTTKHTEFKEWQFYKGNEE